VRVVMMGICVGAVSDRLSVCSSVIIKQLALDCSLSSLRTPNMELISLGDPLIGVLNRRMMLKSCDITRCMR